MNTSAIKSLQKKILDANFSEPKSLFSGTSLASKASALNQSASKSAKKKFIGMSNPFDYSNLETVHEKVNDKSFTTLDLSGGKSNFKKNPLTQG
jgi:hypothetical protein